MRRSETAATKKVPANNFIERVLRAVVSNGGMLGLTIFLSAGAAQAASGSAKEWVKLENCALIPNDSNDGDSFHVRSSDGSEYVFRLYLVDAPEIESVAAGRLVEQADYFGVSVPEVIEVGRRAKQLVDEKLAQPFTVFTHMAGGLGRSKIPRFLGFVQVKDGDLGELLVFNGLARIHGTRGAPPGVASSADEIARLQSLEQKAKAARRGGWNVAGMASQKFAATPAAEAVTIPGVAANPTKRPPAPMPSVRVKTDADGSKLDINEATQEDLENLPGVGQAMSARIIAARPFKSADDLRSVKGIGNGKRYQDLRPYFQ